MKKFLALRKLTYITEALLIVVAIMLGIGLLNSGLIFMAIILIGTFVVWGVFTFLEWRYLQSSVKPFLYECKPETFIESSKVDFRDIPRLKQSSRNFSFWFVPIYCEALVDVGRGAEAKEMLRETVSAGKPIKDTEEKLFFWTSSLYIIKNIYGDARYRECFSAILTVIESGTLKKPDPELLRAIEEQKMLIEAEENMQEGSFACLHVRRKDNEALPMYYRVRSAYEAAAAYRKLGDSLKEEELLEFVVAEGNELSVVPRAVKRLKELES